MKAREARRTRLAATESPHPGHDMKKNRMFNMALGLIAFILTCCFIAFGAYFQVEEGLGGISVGYPSNVDILAPREVENTSATARNREEAEANAAALHAIYMLDPTVWPHVELNLRVLAEDMAEVRAYYAQELAAFRQAQLNADSDFALAEIQHTEAMVAWEALRASILANDDDTREIPEPPTPPIEPEPLEPDFQVWAQFELLAPEFSESEQELIVSMDDDAYEIMWEIIMDVAYNTQATNIYQVDFRTLGVMESYLGPWALDSGTRSTIEKIIERFLTTNRIENIEATQSNRESIANNYQRVMILEGASIVRVGDIVTQDMYTVLEQLGLLEDATIGDLAFPMAGAFFIVALLFLACVMYLHFYRPTVAAIGREAFLLFTLYVLTLTAVWALRDFSYPFIPILIFPMLVSVLIERRAAVVLSFAMVIINYFVVAASWDYLMFFLISGLVIAMLSRFTTERNKIFIIGVAVSIIQFALSIAIAVIVDLNQALYSIPGLFTTAMFAAFNGLLVVILSTGSLPIWETFFGVVTPVKLMDLTNPTNLLLRRLTIEAPGTYHHSLIVANLAETAAYDIGANAHAARVGGYYHDIGKLKHPHFFAENLDGANPHDHLDPIDSARIIIGHISYGLRLATEHKLPQFVRDIIQEHHGNSLIQFFYHKAMETEKNVNEKDYRYPYQIPQTRESACVSLADAVEAAMRAMMPKLKSPEEVEGKIRELVNSRLASGQLADSQLSIKDVEIIMQSFIRVLKGMYHERITYPKLVPVGDAESVISAGGD
ncbi:MAG: HDIG domain-containing protein [Defluviitaleaceae bacterium]|nr:HDIG domain-containing protein [Defluviitaleaceae bacterium]